MPHARCLGSFLAPFDLGQYLIDGDAGFREVVEGGIEPQQKFEDAFIDIADERSPHFLAFRGERGAMDRWDLTDGDLAARRIEERLDVVQRDLISRIVDR